MPEQIKTALQELLAAYFEIQLSTDSLRLSIEGNMFGYALVLTELRHNGAFLLADAWHVTDNPKDASVIAMRLDIIKDVKNKLNQFSRGN